MNHGPRHGTIGIPALSIRVEKQKNFPTLNYSSYGTGGDDLKLKVWDARCGFESPILVNRRSGQRILVIELHSWLYQLWSWCHYSAMQSSYRTFNCSWEVGSIYPNLYSISQWDSYNNLVQLFDARKPLVPFAHVDVGGGAWRVKWHPSFCRKRDLLVASMQDGFKIVTFDEHSSDGDLPVRNSGRLIRRFDEHTSLAYGVDWSFALFTNHDTIIGSCSFYDHTLHLWQG